jgi:hypothetical protein
MDHMKENLKHITKCYLVILNVKISLWYEKNLNGFRRMLKTYGL